MKTVRNVLGETREVSHVWPDGAYNCPFCGAAVSGHEERCPNPACEAGGASAHTVRQRRHERAEREQRQAAERERWQRIAEAQRAERARRASEVEQARQDGYCVRCLVRRGRRVRHRRPDYHETT